MPSVIALFAVPLENARRSGGTYCTCPLRPSVTLAKNTFPSRVPGLCLLRMQEAQKGRLEDGLFAFGEEVDVDGDLEDALLEFGRDLFGVDDALGVLLSGGDHGRGVVVDGGEDGADVGVGVFVVVREVEVLDNLVFV